LICGLVIAQVEHGPNMHGGALGVVMVLVAVAVAAGLVYLVAGRRRAHRDTPRERDAGASDRRPEG
jgi:hypothetical protein